MKTNVQADVSAGVSSEPDEASLQAALNQQWLAAQAGYRTPSAIVFYVFAVAAMMVLGSSDMGQSVLAARPRELATGLGSILAAMVLASVLYHSRGVGSKIYRFADHLESFANQAVAMGLIICSGHGQSPFWLVSLAHMTMLPVDPRARDRRFITAVVYGGPALVTLYFLIVAHDLHAAALAVGGSFAGALTWRNTQAKKRALAIELAKREHEAATVRRLRVADERMRIARELHAGLGSGLVDLIEHAGVLLPRCEPAVQAALRGLVDRSGASLEELRSMVWFVEGPSRSWHDLVDHAEERLAELVNHRAALDLRVKARTASERIPAEVCLALLRMLQESTRNALTHGGARTVRVELALEESAIHATIADDGQGMPTTIRSSGKGLSNMRARAAALGGTFDIGSTATGTRAEIRLPSRLFGKEKVAPAGSS